MKIDTTESDDDRNWERETLEAVSGIRCFACENPDGEGNTYCIEHYHA